MYNRQMLRSILLAVLFILIFFRCESLQTMTKIRKSCCMRSSYILGKAKLKAGVLMSSKSDAGGSDQKSIQLNSFAILNSVAVLWGTQHVVIKNAIESYPSTSLLNFWRFAISMLLFFPAFLNTVKNGDKVTWRAGIELSLYTFLGFAFQAIGLETTIASRSAFLLYLNVKIVPFLAAVFFKREISSSTWVSAFLALSGTCLLSTDGGPLNTGDLWCIAAAVASALFILRLESFSRSTNAAGLNGVSFAGVTLLCSLWLGGDFISHDATMAVASGEISSADGLGSEPSETYAQILTAPDTLSTMLDSIFAPFVENPWPALYLGGVSTGLCNYLQTIGQRTISAEKAAIIYSLDPVYGAIFSRIFLDERLGLQGFCGAGLILAGVWLSARADQEKSIAVEEIVSTLED